MTLSGFGDPQRHVAGEAGHEGTAYAVRTDGTVWAWGDNLYLGLGNDQVADYSAVPVRVTGLTGVSAVAGGWRSGYVVVPSSQLAEGRHG